MNNFSISDVNLIDLKQVVRALVEMMHFTNGYFNRLIFTVSCGNKFCTCKLHHYVKKLGYNWSEIRTIVQEKQ